MATVPAAEATNAPSSGVMFGLVDGRLLGAAGPVLDADLTQDASEGITAVRAQLSWNAVEHTPGVYAWAPFDQLVQAVAAHHMALLVLIDFTPPWARTPGCYTWQCAPANPAQFASFAAAAATRYGPDVKAWEVWNEPNSDGFWRPRPDAGAYSQLLADTAAAIRAADQGAYVVSGGLAPERDNGRDVDPVTFLSGVCSAGALGSVDAVGMHPYSFPYMPDYPAKWNAWQAMASTPTSVRSVMTGCGAAAEPIWITEYGAPTGGPGLAGSYGESPALMPGSSHVSPQRQAAMISQAVADLRSYGWVGAFFVYSATDLGTIPTTNQNFFGLRTYGGQPKPAWAALRLAIES
jgi:hypothetical protein